MKLYLRLKKAIERNGIEGQILINILIILFAVILTTINIAMMRS